MTEKHRGYEYSIWPFGNGFSWATLGIHEDGVHRIAAGGGDTISEMGAQQEAVAHINAWADAGDASGKALGSSFVGGMGTVTAHPAATVVQEDDGT